MLNMNQRKINNFKKTLVRNTEEPVSKITFVNNEIDDNNIMIEKNDSMKSNNNINMTKLSNTLSKANLSNPLIQSTHGLVKEMSSVDNVRARKIKSLSDIDKRNKIAIDEKLTRKVNFRYDQPIYKDLIPLCVKPAATIAPICREPQPLKDREPNLSDFCRQKTLPEYKYQVPAIVAESVPIKEYDGLSLYRLTSSWRDNK